MAKTNELTTTYRLGIMLIPKKPLMDWLNEEPGRVSETMENLQQRHSSYVIPDIATLQDPLEAKEMVERRIK